jgi:hypothetical protein
LAIFGKFSETCEIFDLKSYRLSCHFLRRRYFLLLSPDVVDLRREIVQVLGGGLLRFGKFAVLHKTFDLTRYVSGGSFIGFGKFSESDKIFCGSFAGFGKFAILAKIFYRVSYSLSPDPLVEASQSELKQPGI